MIKPIDIELPNGQTITIEQLQGMDENTLAIHSFGNITITPHAFNFISIKVER